MTARSHHVAPPDPTDPATLTPEQRLAEVCAILAAGILRLRRRCALSAPLPSTKNLQIPQESGAMGLELSPEMRLHVQLTGRVNALREPEIGVQT